ncbi:hypothetical protein Psch_03474 [Pelotomaculum schinkii]|uniref:Uncharacterized protein n=1 Tax=Pelotomaculum schinkii TaxID=78350 RepID=A0A4Y7R7I6_9FIRM|nr:hypothetical protein [Pelotomaculum schinkii]TEB04712.1 hypothetical protein Psch_03474 [Pelotomaculum schinkii]
MLGNIKVKLASQVDRLVDRIHNEEGNLQTFATIVGLTFVSVMLIWGAYQILESFFPDFLNSMLNQIKSKFTIS